MRRARRRNHDIGLAGRIVELLKRNHPAVELIGHRPRPRQRPVGHQDGARSLLHQVARSQFAHLARADQEHSSSVQRAEDLPRQVHCHRRNRNAVRADLGLGPHFFRRRKCALQQMLQLPAHCPGRSRHRKSFFYLAQNLRLAHHHRIETRRHPEKVPHGLLVAVLVEVVLQHRPVQPEMILQKLRKIHRRRLNRGHNLHPVAGRNDHALRHPRQSRKGPRDLGQIFARNGDPLPQVNGRGLVVYADQGQGRHEAPYLCTWLNRFAAHTASITRNTAPDR